MMGVEMTTGVGVEVITGVEVMTGVGWVCFVEKSDVRIRYSAHPAFGRHFAFADRNAVLYKVSGFGIFRTPNP
jgi:hypothetical protein